MASYVVMEPENGGGENAVLVRDSFAFFAFLIPFIWLLWHRLWIEAALALAAMLGLSLLGSVAGLGQAAPYLSLLVSVLIGLEARNLHVAALRRRGWREWGVVEAANRDDAETIYLFDKHGGDEIEATAQPSAARPPQPWSASSGPALGLLSYPHRR